MNYNVSVLSSEIDVPKQLKQVKNSFLDSYSQNVDSKSETNNNMGVENTWTDDELVVAPIPDLPIPLPAPSTSVEVSAFDEALNTHEVYPDLDCLFSPLGQPNVAQDEPIFDGVVGRGEAGVCGLRNLGNTCFMGAGVQCLVATAPLAAALLRVPFSPSSPLTNCLADMTRRIWTGRYVTIQPTAFKVALATHFPQFNDFRQHDCQEFLALLLDGLHEQLNTASNKDIACQVEPREFRAPPTQHKVVYKDTGVQSTSQETGNHYSHAKCNEKTSQQLSRDEKPAKDVKESREHPKRNNTDKSTHMETPPVRSSAASCEPCSSGSRSTSDNNNIKCDNNTLNCDNKQQHLNNQQMALIAREENNIPVVNNAVQRNKAASSGSGGGGSGAALEQLILKDNKTSNLNVLGVKEEPNNEIRFDSEKYSKIESSRRRCEPFNVNSLHSYENNSTGKRCTNVSFSLDVKERLDLKRVKLHSSTEESSEKNKMMEIERQLKSPDALLDKNERMECERKEISKECSLAENGDVSNLPLIVLDIPFDKTSEPQADQHWLQHLASNRSVVVNTFQGQFKSTVVCSVCKYISVTYEPFMYLSVPLPNAMQKKLHVTYVGESLKHPTEYLLELNKYDSVDHLRAQILSKVGCDLKGPILIAEVLNHHIAKILEDHQLIRYLNDSDRSLYAFEVSTLLEITTSSTSSDDSKVEDGPLETSCIICLEDKESDMKQHDGCSCILCESCIVASCTHNGGDSFDCPVCRKHVLPETDLKPVIPSQVTSRMMNVPLVFRVDTVGDGNNNQKNVLLFGHPMLIRVPNRCSDDVLRTAIHTIVPYKEPYRLLLVDGQGLHCSRCMFHTHCRGCDLPPDVVLSSSDSLAITFTGPVEVLPTTCSISTLSDRTNSLSLYDCIQAFSQSELLDGNNPWYCPQCRQNRCATKTLSVWRYPDYLIVYLKRFVFHNQISTKLEEKVLFPLSGLALASCAFSYDLYACVCHIGGVSAGHYTTYSQHPYTGQWHYYNDSFVSKQAPLEEDYSNAYILFYKKQGLEPPSIEGMNGTIHEGDC